MEEMNAIKTPHARKLKRNWGWLLALGVLFVILGCIGLGMTISLTLVSMFFFGVLLFIAGISQIIDVFKCKEWKGSLWHTLIAILYLIGSGIVIYDPFFASSVITMLLAVVLIFIGVTRFFMALILRGLTGWGWILVASFAAIILGILILIQWPLSGMWIIGLFIAIELIVNGWAYIVLALSMRHA